jgi:hypothetical protein
LRDQAKLDGSSLIVVGDCKTPQDFKLEGAEFYSISDQKSLDYNVLDQIPKNSYTRKMIGYLEAYKSKSLWIQETDDDNAPYENFTTYLSTAFKIDEFLAVQNKRWFNPFVYFSGEKIWPRGYPLELVQESFMSAPIKAPPSSFFSMSLSNVGCVQALADGNPDVDAIYRLLVNQNLNFTFDKADAISIPKNLYAPFNSQATSFRRELISLMYLPITCSFRMTDIWRSFVFQRILRETNFSLVYFQATVFQDRNEHNLLSDFALEVPGYLQNAQIAKLLDETELKFGELYYHENLQKLYSVLVKEGFLDKIEMLSLTAWLKDIATIDEN